MVFGDGAVGGDLVFVGPVAEILAQGGLAPFDHGIEGEEPESVGPGLFAHVQIVGLDAVGDGAEEGVDGGEGFTGEEGTAEAGEAIGPQFFEAHEIVVQLGGDLIELDADTHIHAADVAQVTVAAVHFGCGAAGPGAGFTLFGPDVLMLLGDIFRDGEGVPHGDIAIDEDRNLAARREGGEAAAVAIGVETVQHFLERDSKFLQQHPGPQRPGGVVLVGDMEGVHGGSGLAVVQSSGRRARRRRSAMRSTWAQAVANSVSRSLPRRVRMASRIMALVLSRTAMMKGKPNFAT